MKRITTTLLTVAALSAAAPVAALSVSIDFPNLTYPPQPAPDATQGCADLTTLNGDACTTTSK